MIPRILRRVGLTLLVLCGLVRFVGSGLLPATQALRGDFGAVFPAPALAASLRPDFPINQFWAVWHGDTVWYYGPMFHVLTLPLFLAPSWNMVPPLWALVNLIAVVAAFAFCWRLAAPASSTARGEHLALLAGLWLLYQPLVNCFAQGNIELIELAVILGAIGLAHRGRLVSAGVVLGIGTMTKLLPVGFLVWLGVRGSRRALMAGGITIALIAALTAVTLGWEHSAEVDRFLERFRIVGIKGTMLSFPALVASWLGTVDWPPPLPRPPALSTPPGDRLVRGSRGHGDACRRVCGLDPEAAQDPCDLPGCVAPLPPHVPPPAVSGGLLLSLRAGAALGPCRDSHRLGISPAPRRGAAGVRADLSADPL